MEAAGVLGVGGGFKPLVVDLTGVAQIGVEGLGVVVGIDEIVAGVVGRIDVDHLHLAVIRLLEEFEDFQVVALDEYIAGGVPIDGFVGRGDEGGEGRCLHGFESVSFAGPFEAVAFLTGRGELRMLAEHRFELVKIHRHLVAAMGICGLGDGLGKQALEQPPLVGGNVKGRKIELFRGFWHGAWRRG